MNGYNVYKNGALFNPTFMNGSIIFSKILRSINKSLGREVLGNQASNLLINTQLSKRKTNKKIKEKKKKKETERQSIKKTKRKLSDFKNLNKKKRTFYIPNFPNCL